MTALDDRPPARPAPVPPPAPDLRGRTAEPLFDEGTFTESEALRRHRGRPDRHGRIPTTGRGVQHGETVFTATVTLCPRKAL